MKRLIHDETKIIVTESVRTFCFWVDFCLKKWRVIALERLEGHCHVEDYFALNFFEQKLRQSQNLQTEPKHIQIIID